MPQDLEKLPLLSQFEHDGAQVLELLDATGAKVTVEMRARLISGEFSVLYEAAKRGMGVTIVVFASTNAFFAEESNVPYSATKGGLVMFVRNAAMDLARHRIRINAVDPGIIDTRLSAALVHDPVAGPDYLKRIPAGRTAPPTTSRRWCCSWPRTTRST